MRILCNFISIYFSHIRVYHSLYRYIIEDVFKKLISIRLKCSSKARVVVFSANLEASVQISLTRGPVSRHGKIYFTYLNYSKF